MKVYPSQKFYDNNFNDIVHIQYLAEILKLVPDVITTNERQKTVDRYEISVDEHGENPIKIIGTDEDGNKTELHLNPEITHRVNEIIRENIEVFTDDTQNDWTKIKFIKNTEMNCFELECNLQDGNTVNTVIPNMTADDLKQINQIKAYDKKLVVKFIEEDNNGDLIEREKVYNFDLYVTKEEFTSEIDAINEKLANVGEVHQLSDKACSYDCNNHGKIGHCVIYNLGETQHMLLNFDADFQGCLNKSLVRGEEWVVTCHPIDLTTNEEYTDQRNWQPCTVEMVYHSGERILLEAQCNITQVKFTIPNDAVRDNIAHCWLKGILYFD